MKHLDRESRESLFAGMDDYVRENVIRLGARAYISRGKAMRVAQAKWQILDKYQHEVKQRTEELTEEHHKGNAAILENLANLGTW